MLLFLVTCFSFIFLHKSLSHDQIRSFPFSLWPLSWKAFSLIPSKMSLTNKKTTMAEEEVKMSVLDLPELTLECILERLPPSGLLSMSGVCTSLRERCSSDHLWERHLNQKWGRLMGPAAHREWLWHIASKEDSATAEQGRRRLLMKLISRVWPLSWITVMLNPSSSSRSKDRNSAPVNTNSIMSWYLALETGSFCFPAQVYNRENGHVGFMLSCYDAEISYNPGTDSFNARYPPHGRRAIAVESGVSWERLRAPPVDTSPHDLHISECLNNLHPGDHIEIQWRRNKEYPYGWWYGVVGHLESCDGSENYCRCHCSDSVVLEFNQYTPGSRWRRATINRKEHQEEGNEASGFYGGIRKLQNSNEISTWKRLWPTEVLQ